MSSAAQPQGEVKKWRLIVFVIVAGLLTLFCLYAGVGNLLLLDGQPGFPSDIHRWHQAQSGVLTALLLGGSLLALLWQPQRRPLLIVFVVLSLALASLAFATVSGNGFSPLVLAIGVALICILIVVYPAPWALLYFRQARAPSYFLLLLTIIAAVLLAPIIARELNWQIIGISGQDVHAQNYHWLTSVLLALMLILAGSLAATRQAGSQVLGFIIGIAFLYLGGAALLLPGYAGSWGSTGGVLGILGGLGYIIVTAVEGWKSRSRLIDAKAGEPQEV